MSLEKRGAAKSFDQMYVGQVSGQPHTFVALGRKGNTAIAYVCDGTRVGTWFTGSAAGTKLTLKAADGSTLGGSTSGATPKFVLTRDGYPVAATLRPASDRDFFIRFRIKPPYQSVGGIIGIRGVLRGLTDGTAPTSAPTPPPATSTPTTGGATLSGPGVTLTTVPASSTSLTLKDQCATLAAQYAANRAALESELKRGKVALEQAQLQLSQLTIARAALLQKKKAAGLTTAESARLAQLETDIDALQRQVADRAAALERIGPVLDSLLKSYQQQRLRLGCP